MIGVMRVFLSAGLKDNYSLERGFMTGILRVAKEGFFSGLNNIVVYSVLDEKYSRYLGFTPEEVKDILYEYGKSFKMNEVVEWYDGYHIGDCEIFNPWSVINYVDNDFKPRPYWTQTSSNTMLGDIMEGASGIATEKIQQALRLKDAYMLQEAMEEFLLCTVSYYDTTNESFYHGLVLGVVAMFSIYYEISSNREAGKGRYDIMLRPRDKERPAYIIELKALKKTNIKDEVEESLLDSELEGLALDALSQIKDKEYYENLCEDNCSDIVLVGMAFYKKKCCIEIEK